MVPLPSRKVRAYLDALTEFRACQDALLEEPTREDLRIALGQAKVTLHQRLARLNGTDLGMARRLQALNEEGGNQ